LLWQSRTELRSENLIADLEINLPKPDYPVNYLLDGQQRLSTICGAMYWKGQNPTSGWNIAYDLRKETFFHLESMDDPPLHQVRVNKLSDASAFFGHLASISTDDKDALNESGKRLFNRFKDYKVATVTLGDMSLQDVAPIFERINSSGTPLTIVDLMRAATWSPEFDLIDSIDGLLGEFTDKGFAGIDRKVVLRNLSASAGGGFSVESIDSLRNYSADQLKTATTLTEESYRRAVDFLVTQIRVENATVLPYKNQLTVLSEIFRLIPSPNASQYAAISQWFWRTAVAGYFGGWNTGNMTSDQHAVAAFAEGKTDSITPALAKPRSDIWKTRVFRRDNAHAKLLAIVLAHHHPMDLLTLQAIDITKALAWTNAKEFHHFFPKKFLERRGESQGKINCLANIVMLTSASNKIISDLAPSTYLVQVAKESGERLPEILESNLIPRAAFEAALRDDFDSFLELRSQYIHDAVLSKAGWSESEESDEAASDPSLDSEEEDTLE